MIRHTFTLLRILSDPKIVSVPFRVLRELKKRGIRRLPERLDAKMDTGLPGTGAGLSGTDSRLPMFSSLTFLHTWLGSELIHRHQRQWVINSFLPPFPGTAFNRMFENLLSGRRFSPVSAFLAITAKCPYTCWHCSLATRKSGYLSTAAWLHAVEQLHGLGVSIVGFTGGEPLARPDLAELVRAVHDGGAVSILFTSGAGFTEDHARALKQAGLWAVCVSLDTTEPDAYDRMRSHDGAFQQALHTLRLSKKYGFYTMTGSVATRQFVEQRMFEQVYQLAREEGLDEMRIVEPMPCGKLARDQEQCLLTPEHVATLRQFHIDTNRRGKLPKVCAFNHIEGPEIFGCAGGIQHLYIDSAGEVCPCDFTPMSFGNVIQEDLADIWHRMQTAMNLPKQHCFIQRHHALIDRYREHGYPLPKEISMQVCEQIEPEPLPAYYAMVLSADSRFAISQHLLEKSGKPDQFDY